MRERGNEREILAGKESVRRRFYHISYLCSFSLQQCFDKTFTFIVRPFCVFFNSALTKLSPSLFVRFVSPWSVQLRKSSTQEYHVIRCRLVDCQVGLCSRQRGAC
ncbi:hypothetical protein KP509_18G022800 [Ceratopteris richardii]|uniref:Uncharacterized protein n=1 Tax=Ceratopteris richardii TaxID=49495 RepID=A0A8T2SQ99_CERRI|nr:hypothetical protein KP509_18G022800 [Ceratopteris richardii]